MVIESDIRELIDSTTKELNVLGYSPIKVYKIRFANARSFYAQVNRVDHELTFSNFFREAPLPQIEATIMHEMIHMCPEAGHGHGSEWKFIAARVNKAYPKYNIHRCGNNSNVVKEEWHLREIAELKRPARRPKVALRCAACGHVYYVSKGSKADRLYMDYKCGVCRGHLIRVE